MGTWTTHDGQVPGFREEADSNPFPDGMEVWVRFPATTAEEKGPREDWPWLTGVIIQRCGPDEWQVQAMAREVATTADGNPAPVNAPDDELWFPLCFRDASEIRLQEGGEEE
jgi:hypothetical protein